MTGDIVLAVSGSNVTGDAPFSCALALGDRIVGASSPAGGRGDLATLVAGLCALHHVQPDQVSALRIDLGPGSYTGLRVAITFVRSLQRFGSLRVGAVDSLSLLAVGGLGPELRGRQLRPLLDARRDRVHCATLHHDDGRLRVVTAAQALPLAAVCDTAGPCDLFVVPRTADSAFGEQLRATGAEVHVCTGITAQDLFSPSLAVADCTAEALEPRYLMASYAED